MIDKNKKITPLVIYKNDRFSTILFLNKQSYGVIGLSQGDISSIYDNSFSQLIVDGRSKKRKLLDELAKSEDSASKNITYKIICKTSGELTIDSTIVYDARNNIFYESFTPTYDHVKNNYPEVNNRILLNLDIINSFINDKDFAYACAIEVETSKVIFANDTLLFSLGLPLDYDYTEMNYYDFFLPLELEKYNTPISHLKEHEYGYRDFTDVKNERYIEVKYKVKTLNNTRILFLQISIQKHEINTKRIFNSKISQSLMLLTSMEILNSNHNSEYTLDKLLSLINKYFYSNISIFIDCSHDDKNIYIKDVSKDALTKTNFKNKIEEDRILSILQNEFLNTTEIYDDDIRNNPHYSNASAYIDKYSIRSILGSSIIKTYDNTLGYLIIVNPKENIDVSNSLNIFSLIFGNYLFNEGLIKKLEHLSYHDSLTKVNNSNSYKMKVKELKKETNFSIGISFIDMNGLKDINDNLGHIVGDNYLNQVGCKLYDIFGEEVYRIGGDEFVVIAEHISEENFINRMNKLIEFNNKEFSKRLAIGYGWHEFIENFNETINKIEQDMYKEKKLYYSNKL